MCRSRHKFKFLAADAANPARLKAQRRPEGSVGTVPKASRRWRRCPGCRVKMPIERRRLRKRRSCKLRLLLLLLMMMAMMMMMLLQLLLLLLLLLLLPRLMLIGIGCRCSLARCAVAISWLHFPVVDFSIKLTLIYLRSLKLLSMAAAAATPAAAGCFFDLACCVWAGFVLVFELWSVFDIGPKIQTKQCALQGQCLEPFTPHAFGFPSRRRWRRRRRRRTLIEAWHQRYRPFPLSGGRLMNSKVMPAARRQPGGGEEAATPLKDVRPALKRFDFGFSIVRTVSNAYTDPNRTEPTRTSPRAQGPKLICG